MLCYLIRGYLTDPVISSTDIIVTTTTTIIRVEVGSHVCPETLQEGFVIPQCCTLSLVPKS
jgi:hypothetical protein